MSLARKKSQSTDQETASAPPGVMDVAAFQQLRGNSFAQAQAGVEGEPKAQGGAKKREWPAWMGAPPSPIETAKWDEHGKDQPLLAQTGGGNGGWSGMNQDGHANDAVALAGKVFKSKKHMAELDSMYKKFTSVKGNKDKKLNAALELLVALKAAKHCDSPQARVEMIRGPLAAAKDLFGVAPGVDKFFECWDTSLKDIGAALGDIQGSLQSADIYGIHGGAQKGDPVMGQASTWLSGLGAQNDPAVEAGGAVPETLADWIYDRRALLAKATGEMPPDHRQNWGVGRTGLHYSRYPELREWCVDHRPLLEELFNPKYSQ